MTKRITSMVFLLCLAIMGQASALSTEATKEIRDAFVNAKSLMAEASVYNQKCQSPNNAYAQYEKLYADLHSKYALALDSKTVKTMNEAAAEGQYIAQEVLKVKTTCDALKKPQVETLGDLEYELIRIKDAEAYAH